jgi:hypothetical protein
MNEVTPHQPILPARVSSHPARLSHFLRVPSADRQWEGLALIVWIIILAMILIRVLVSSRNSVFPIFAEAGRHWRAGAELYHAKNELYRYSPPVTVGFVPLGVLPNPFGESLWLGLNAAVYLAALALWCRSALPGKLDSRLQALLFLLVVPLSIGSLNNGQSNPLVLGLILAGISGAARQYWILAGPCLALATLFKIYPLVIGLLLAVVCGRKVLAWLAIGLLVGLALPFCCQRPAYVWSQYGSWIASLAAENRQLAPPELWYRDLRLLCQALHIPLRSSAYMAIELSVGVGIAVLCWLASRRRPAQNISRGPLANASGWCTAISSREPGVRQALVTLLALGCCWMTALGPATESCTYILLAPSLAWALLDSFISKEPLRRRAMLLTSCSLLLLAQMAVWFPGGFGRRVHSYGVQPAAALLFLVYVVIATLRNLCVARSRPVAPTFQNAA